MIQVTLKQDESCHWYMIPHEMAQEFDRLLYETDDEYLEEFEDTFWKYAIDGPWSVPLYSDALPELKEQDNEL